MNLSEKFDLFKSTAQKWEESLSNYDESSFTLKPSPSEWSIGQVYVHILGGGQGFFMKNAKMCVRGEGTKSEKGLNENGEKIFRYGGFPEGKFPMPGPVSVEPPQPGSISEIRNSLQFQVKKMAELAEEIEGYDPDIRTYHPVFGFMNAGEWYAMNEMHFRHHLRQQARLDEWLRQR